MDLLALVDKLTPVLVVIIPSYFSFKSTKASKESDQKLNDLSDKIVTLEKSVYSIEEIGKDNNKNLTMIGRGLQRIQRFRLQENLKKAIRRGWITQHELDEITRLFESYIELGGNGAIKVLYQRFAELEIREEK